MTSAYLSKAMISLTDNVLVALSGGPSSRSLFYLTSSSSSIHSTVVPVRQLLLIFQGGTAVCTRDAAESTEEF